jgi:putative ABC transport system permease protein
MEWLRRDVEYGLRMLRRNPGFATIAILTLALSIGATTAVFSTLEAVLLRPLPYPHPEQIVNIWETYGRDFSRMTAPYPSIVDWRQQSHAFSDIAAYRVLSYEWILTGQGEAKRLTAVPATSNLFSMLGVTPELGRNLAARDDEPNAPAVVALSHRAWKEQFSEDSNIVGRTIHLDKRAFTVVGVLPPAFRLVEAADVWVPLANGGPAEVTGRSYHPFVAIARLKPGASLSQAQSEMTTIAYRLAQQYPDTDKGWGVRLVGLQEDRVRGVRPALLVLFGAVCLVLLVACANLANLLLARATAREHETAIRIALGASSWQLMRQYLIDGCIVGVLGGTVGLVFATLALRLLQRMTFLDVLREAQITIDLPLLMFVAAVSIGTGLLCGILPARHQFGSQPRQALASARSVSSGSRRVREILVSAEIALALVLLVGAGLLSKSFIRLLSVDPGFRPQGVLAMNLALPEDELQDTAKSLQLVRPLESEISKLPGIERVAVTNSLPLQTDTTQKSRFLPEGYILSPGESLPVSEQRLPSVNYFQAMRIPLREGRLFTEHDYGNSAVIVNETLARHFWRHESPLGHRININPMEKETRWGTIVGVVGDVKQYGLDTPSTLDIYISDPWPRWLVIRTTGDPLQAAESVAQVVRSVSSSIAISSITTLNALVDNSIGQRRLFTVMMNAFGGAGLLLAGIGIYGVMSLLVNQRTREVGVRMALGAQVTDVLHLILGRGLRVALIGWGAGLIAAFFAVRLLQSELFQVRSYDLGTFAAMSVFLISIALAACYFPARRATRVDPMVALHDQ